MDTRSLEQRRRIMQSVRVRNTGPEVAVRSALHRAGYRFRLHRRDLPGKPDIVLPGRRIALFVHGCFWHGHGCDKGKLPKSRLEYWKPKIQKNIERDEANYSRLQALGWKVFAIWQCELREADFLNRLRNRLETTKNSIDFE